MCGNDTHYSIHRRITIWLAPKYIFLVVRDASKNIRHSAFKKHNCLMHRGHNAILRRNGLIFGWFSQQLCPTQFTDRVLIPPFCCLSFRHSCFNWMAWSSLRWSASEKASVEEGARTRALEFPNGILSLLASSALSVRESIFFIPDMDGRSS